MAYSHSRLPPSHHGFRASRFDIRRSTFDVRRSRFHAFTVSRAQGFTLFEILVALAILATSLTVILQLFSGGLRSVRVSDRHTQAVFLAREKMEEVLLEDPPGVGTQEGKFDDGTTWRSRIDRIAPPEDEENKLPFDVYEITVEVGWHEGTGETQLALQTTRLVEREDDDKGESGEDVRGTGSRTTRGSGSKSRRGTR